MSCGCNGNGMSGLGNPDWMSPPEELPPGGQMRQIPYKESGPPMAQSSDSGSKIPIFAVLVPVLLLGYLWYVGGKDK